jgi:hypothetical protein
MAKLELELQREAHRPEIICVDSERVLIGSEAYCDVRLPSDEAAPEHLLLEVSGQSLRVVALSAARPVWLDGRATVRGTIVSGGTIGLGKLAIRVWLDRGAHDAATPRTFLRRAMVTVACGLLLLGLAAAILLSDGAKAGAKAAPPLLWQASPAACPASRPREAIEVALEKETLAEAKAQRQPFIAREGVDAVRLYRVAAECARVAGASDRHAALSTTADSLQSAIDMDYRVRRLRLDYSLKIGDKRTAARETAMLRELLRGEEDAYTRWLTALATKLRGSEEHLLSGVSEVVP